MPSIAHFEIPADDIKRAQNFYSALFGWEIEKTQGPFEYYMISTTDQDGQPGLGGGIMERQHPQQQITNYIEVSSNDETAAKVQQLGGQIVVEKTEVPDMGFFVACVDTENNAFALWESA